MATGFLDVTPYTVHIPTFDKKSAHFYSEDGDRRFLRTQILDLPDHTASQ